MTPPKHVIGHTRLEKPILDNEKAAGTSAGIGIIIGAVIIALTGNVGLSVAASAIQAKKA
ncbi:MAG TPA: hypothetical protein EYQ82_03605 [Dehalococcoidia bacterium]|jgi:hypothetical protein|nr:hypothetical protein [Dehalococcoidia bacterium]